MSRDDYRQRHPNRQPTVTPTGLFAPTADTLTERFARFHQTHPEVYEALLNLALEAKKAGRDRASIKMMYEVVRWHRHLAGQPTEGEFRLNNDFTSRYARLLMLDHPELDGMFELRELHTA